MHNQLVWNGMETIYMAKRLLLAEQGNFKIQLPPDFHHTLFTHLCSDANPGQVEAIDIDGGPEVLEKIGEIRGLEAVTELIQPIAEAGARIHVVSPGPCIEINFSSTP
jgi:hypothetical protein